MCYDKKGENPIVALLPQENGEELAFSYCSNGRFIDSNTIDKNDLMLVGEKKEGWVNVYSDSSCGFIYTTREEAINERAVRTCIDTVHIEWEE